MTRFVQGGNGEHEAFVEAKNASREWWPLRWDTHVQEIIEINLRTYSERKIMDQYFILTLYYISNIQNECILIELTK